MLEKNSTEKLWLQFNLTMSEFITISLELILMVRLIIRTVNYSFLLFLIPDHSLKVTVAKVPGDVLSM